jgi:cathepsin D
VPGKDVTFRNQTYDASKSFTSKVINASTTAFEIFYGDGSGANGPVLTDTVTVAGLVAFNQVFSPTAVEKGFSPSPQDSDGILGMAYQNISSIKQGTPWFTTLYNQGHVFRNLFGFYLAKTGSELILGGRDYSRFVWPLTFTPVTQQGVSVLNKWLINVLSSL